MPAPVATEGEVAAVLGSIVPTGVRAGVRRITPDDLAALHDEESAHVRRAVARRQHEFASGRALLRELIGYRVTIPAAADRSPILPAGVRGSLAHDRDLVVAAISTEPAVRALGIDVEPATPLEPDLADVILREDEVGIDAHRAFTMKEAAYKAWSSLGGRLIDHHDVRLALSGSRFRAEVLLDGRTFDGTSVAAADRWLALVVVTSSDPMLQLEDGDPPWTSR
jgi:4'-phosphopantetheinyl transferase EntD